MASPFDSLTLATIQQHLAAATPAWAAENALYLAGDHWQGGAGWTGPWPDALDPEAQRVQAEIARAFTPQNAIGEVAERHVGGVVGKEPAWGLTVRRPLRAMGRGSQPTRAEQALIDEAEAALTSWWDARKLLTFFQGAAEGLLAGGRAPVRLFVPAGLRVGGIVPQAASLEAALTGYCYVDRPALAAATVITDPDTQQRCGVYAYQTAEGQTVAELTYVDLATGQTVLRVLRGGAAAAEAGAWPLGGLLLLDEARRSPFLTEPVRRLQRQLNLARTMSGRNIVQGGFLERLILGGQLPGEWVDDPAAPVGPDGTRKRFVAKPLKVGAGRTNFISGQPIRDAQGRITGYTTPSVVYRDPVSTATFREAAEDDHRAILSEARQLHALMGADSTATGESRVQARADFAKSLLATKAQLDATGRWLIEAALALASVFAGQPGRYAGLRATFDCRIDTGPLTAAERAQIVAEVEKGVLSLETALAMLGHDDVDAELARIAAEKAARQAEARAIATPPDPDAPGQEPAGEGETDPPDGAQGRAPTPPAQGGQ
ncbi:MAG TPA: hypothetical protein PKD53_00430 [Chloroflexaceae bacterium]|nr:hypothetical protein [Chloroflexaceae bacterium]